MTTLLEKAAHDTFLATYLRVNAIYALREALILRETTNRLITGHVVHEITCRADHS